MAQEHIGRYRVIEEIASGSQGTVFRAHDPSADRTVALKVLHPEMARDPQYVERFRREATLAASTDHPNIVQIFEVGQAGGLFFMPMEFLPSSLADSLRHSEDEPSGLPVEIAAPAMHGEVLPFSPAQGPLSIRARVMVYLSPEVEGFEQERVNSSVAHEFAHVLLHPPTSSADPSIEREADAKITEWGFAPACGQDSP